MSKTVFVLGAGFNRFLEMKFHLNDSKKKNKLSFYFDSKELTLPPPVSNDFFKYVLRTENSRVQTTYGIKEEVLNYIKKWFNRTKQDLKNRCFDLELFFTFLTSQINEAKEQKNRDLYVELLGIQHHLVHALGTVFFELEWQLPKEGREKLKKFGEIIYKTSSDVITFNYDCLAEVGIETASGETGEKLKNGNPRYNWNRYAAYGTKFTKLRLNGSNYWDGTDGRNEAKAFYKNSFKSTYKSSFIKLHGSYNWFKYSEFLRRTPLKRDILAGKILPPISKETKPLPERLKNEILCFNADWQWGNSPVWSAHSDKYVLEPLIIPPILNKEEKIQQNIFSELWHAAKETMLNCEEIVFIGYSFPDTDFYAKKLFLEVFSINKNIKVTIVNPLKSIRNKFRRLVNYKGPIQYYKYGSDYIENYKFPE